MNNNQLKPLFRNVDLKPNPLMIEREEVSVVELKSFYNNINQILPGIMIQERPVDKLDLDVIRHNLCLTFENRVNNVLLNTVNILHTRLSNLENKVRKFISDVTNEDFYPNYAIIDAKDSFRVDDIIYEIKEKIPYVTDLMFYFNINEDFTCLKTIALNISTMVYNNLRFEISIRGKKILSNDEVQLLNEVINEEFRKFTNSLTEDLYRLVQEANTIYFVSGDYEFDENGNIVHSIVKEQAEYDAIEARGVLEEDYNEQERTTKFLQALEDIF